MSTATDTIESLVKQEYKYGFYTDVETESAPPGLSEDTIRLISRKKNEPEWLTDWRLKAFRHWQTMQEPTWPKVHHEKINYQDIVYYSAPKKKGDGPKSLEEVDPKLLETYEKLGIPLRERERLAARLPRLSASGSPAWPWTRGLTAFRSARRSKSSSPRRVSSSARSAKRCRNIPTS